VRRKNKNMAKSNLEQHFLLLIKDAKLPIPEQEYKFCKDRKWRFDFAYPDLKIAVELEGAVWTQGRHTRGQGFINDTIKYNNAVVNGWKVLRYTSETIQNSIEDIKILLDK